MFIDSMYSFTLSKPFIYDNLMIYDNTVIDNNIQNIWIAFELCIH